MIKLEWKRKTEKYSNGIRGYLGKIAVGSIDWDSCRNNSDLKYKVTCTLPQTKPIKTNFSTEEEGKNKLISIVNAWVYAAGITQ